MKLLRVINTMDPVMGGLCQGIRNALPEWDKAGHTTHILSLDLPDAPFIAKENLPLIPIGPAKTPWLYSPKLLPWLLNHLGEYDAVIVEGMWQCHSFSVTKAIRILKKRKQVNIPKVFIMPHGMLDPYFQKAPERRLKAIRNFLYWHLIENRIINQADGILFTCEEELRLARTTFSNYHPKRELNVGFGIALPPARTDDMDLQFAAICPLAAAKPYILFLSRIHPKKGADLLLQAYLEAYKKSERVDFPLLVVAGPGMDTPYGQSLLAFVEDNQLHQQVCFPGMLSGNAKWGAFYNCQAYALTSHQENFGISVVEAMACGKPVLISNQVNIWREIKASGGGIVDNDDIQGVRIILNQWFGMSQENKKQMGVNAFNAFEKHFNIASASATMMNTIKSVYAQ